jgi:hypothetical protein
MPIQGNLLSYADESFEGGTLGDWVASGTTTPTAAVSTAQALDGTHSCQITSAGTSFAGLAWNTTRFPVTVGTIYTLSFWCYTTLTGRSATAEINWYNSGGTFVSDAATGQVLTANTWSLVSTQAACPASITTALPLPLPIASASGQVFYIDEIFFGVLPDYPGSAVDMLHNSTQAVSRAHLW